MDSSWSSDDDQAFLRVIAGGYQEGEEIGMDEIEDFTRLPYPAEWDDDAENSDMENEMVQAAYAWYRAVELLLNQGFARDECEAEIMRRCAKVSRGQRALIRRISEAENDYARMAANETLCQFPWGRLCPEHGNTLVETRRGVRCEHEGCERRWTSGHSQGHYHCDLPAVVVTDNTRLMANKEFRLCAIHHRMYGGRVLRTLPAAPDGSTGGAGPDSSEDRS